MTFERLKISKVFSFLFHPSSFIFHLFLPHHILEMDNLRLARLALHGDHIHAPER